jgi:glycerate kinase
MKSYEKILVAPSAYKGTLDADQLAQAIASGVRSVQPETLIVCAPIADGGDGTLAAIHAGAGGTFETVEVMGALGDPHAARWLKLDELAIVELASASGIAAISPERLRALDAHTIGTGQVIMHCLERGMKDVVICVGGSASTDGGAGLLSALGARFLDRYGNPLVAGGGALLQVASCDLHMLNRWSDVRFRVATDVTSPLLGASGAAEVFAPQKGASQAQVMWLDAALAKFADVLEKASGRIERSTPGSGAAGGTAFGLACALGAEIMPGFAWLSRLLRLEEKIAASDLVITAEGRLDHQSIEGKATGELAKLCLAHGKPLWVVPAIVEPNLDWRRHHIALVAPTCKEREPASFSTVSAAVADLFR